MVVGEMSATATLMGLPTEIRQKIFSLVTQENGDIDGENKWLTEHLGDLVAIHYSESKPPRLLKAYKGASGHQLSRASRTCYQEAAPLLYSGQGFYLFNDYDWSMWWRIQPSLYPPSFELYHMKHPVPNAFAFIRDLAFQPTPETSIDFVKAVERNFQSLRTLRAFRHIYMHGPLDMLTGELPDVWREFHRFVLLAALIVTTHHSVLKFAKWSDWRYYSDKDAKESVRTMTVKLTPDELLSPNEVCSRLMILFKLLTVDRRDCWTWNVYRGCHCLMLTPGRRRSTRTASALRTSLWQLKTTLAEMCQNRTAHGPEGYGLLSWQENRDTV